VTHRLPALRMFVRTVIYADLEADVSAMFTRLFLQKKCF